MLEAEVALVAEVVRGLRVADDDDVLDADAVATVGVVSGLCTVTGYRLDERSRHGEERGRHTVGDGHARLQRCAVVR